HTTPTKPRPHNRRRQGPIVQLAVSGPHPAHPEFRSSPPGTNPALQAYIHQLACMEHELENFLSEVRNWQGALGAKAGKEREPPNLKKWGSDKLCITVYEIADKGARGSSNRGGGTVNLRGVPSGELAAGMKGAQESLGQVIAKLGVVPAVGNEMPSWVAVCSEDLLDAHAARSHLDSGSFSNLATWGDVGTSTPRIPNQHACISSVWMHGLLVDTAEDLWLIQQSPVIDFRSRNWGLSDLPKSDLPGK
ncbi:hypothetical protein L345_15906, partial [Ophiophagus hannah]